MRRWCAWALWAGLLFYGSPALAHQNSVTYLAVDVEGLEVHARFRIESLDLNEALGVAAGRDVTRAESLARSADAARYLAARFAVENMGHRCAPGAHRAELRERDGGSFELVVSLAYACPHTIERLKFHYDLFFDVDPHHQGMATLDALGTQSQAVFKRNAREAEVGEPQPLRAQIKQYVLLGVEHIFIGYDHIAFLFGLVLVAGARGIRRGAREVLAIVTAFTLAHSITLVSAALGWVTLSSRVVEPAIALSILVVAIENLLPREPRARWALTFAFGLVHGFGFAGALGELGLPARATVPSLLAFNLGVELGQLTVVAAALPVLSLLARGAWRRWELALVLIEASLVWLALRAMSVTEVSVTALLFAGVPLLFLATRRWGYAKAVRRGGSVVLGVLAIVWFIERVSGRSAFGGHLG